MSDHPLFVYGTLLPGALNAHVAERLGCTVLDPAWLTAGRGLCLVHCGHLPYPHLVPRTPGEHVSGMLLQVPQSAWLALDDFEDVDEEYERRLVTVQTRNEHLSAWCYHAREDFPLRDAQPVPDGDWLRYWQNLAP